MTIRLKLIEKSSPKLVSPLLRVLSSGSSLEKVIAVFLLKQAKYGIK
jgi:hypothetical protein